jgi:hypothetical protein
MPPTGVFAAFKLSRGLGRLCRRTVDAESSLQHVQPQAEFHVIWSMISWTYAIISCLYHTQLSRSPEAGSLPLLHMIMKLVCVYPAERSSRRPSPGTCLAPAGQPGRLS